MVQLKNSNQLQSEVWQGYQTSRIVRGPTELVRGNAMATKLSLSCLLVNERFVVRRQSQSRPSRLRNGRCTSRSQDGHLSKTLMSEARRQHCPLARYLSSGCTIYPKRLVDIRATRETLSFLSVLDLGWSLSKAYKEEGPLEHLFKCAWVGWERPWTSHLLICLWHHETDSFWRETRATATFCDTSVRTKLWNLCIL